jgi:hypothetical protein
MGEWMGACVRIVCVHAREIEDGRRGGGGQDRRAEGRGGFCGTWKYFASFLRNLEIFC